MLSRSWLSFAVRLPCFCLLLLIAGCGSAPVVPLANLSLLGVHGSLHGGQQPIAGADVKLYSAGSTADGSAASSLLITNITTDAGGAFNISGLYVCPSPSAEVYLVGSGGNPGLGMGKSNPQLALMAALGPCGALNSATFIQVNEVTTVAAVYALAPYMTSLSGVGSSAYIDPFALVDAFNLAAQFANVSAGSSPGTGVPAGYTVNAAQINTVANILAACINSSGGTAGDGTACGNFFLNTTTPNGVPATDTIGALLNLAKTPSLNTLALYNSASATPPFQPSQPSVPPDFSITLTSNAPGVLTPGANVQIPFTEGSGTVAHDLSGNHNDCTFASGLSAPVWVAAGIDHLPATPNSSTPRYCTFAPSVTRTDLSEINSRTRTWCGYLIPVVTGMTNPSFAVLLGSSNRTGLGAFWMSGARDSRSYYYAGSYAGNAITSATAQSTVGWHCITMTLGSTTDSTKDRFFYDAAEVATYSNQGRSWDFRTVGEYDSLGFLPWNPLGFFEGLTSYLIEYPSVLTPAQIAVNFRSLQSSVLFARSVGTLPPQSVTHANQILCNGDSITNQTPGAVSYCNKFTGLNKTFSVLNIAHSGATLLTMVGNIPLEEAVLFSPNSPLSFASMAGGINDILLNDLPAGALYQQRVVWAQQAAQTGWHPIWLTMPSSAGADSVVQAVNTFMRNGAAALGVTLVDVATDPCLGKTGAYANPTGCNDFSDGLHPNQAGEDSIRNSYVNVINYLTGSTAAAPTLVTAANYQVLPADAFLSVSPGVGSSLLTLPSCIGFSATTPFTVTNSSSSSTVSVAPTAGQILNGALAFVTVPNGATVTFIPAALPPTNAGCAWTSQ